jgi:hypothetical protein
MSARSAPIVMLPQVLEDGSLLFDPSGPVPDSLPMFEKRENRFFPIFQPCQFRSTAQRPLTSAPG